MPRLSLIDLAMFMLETPERPFGIGPLVVLRPPEGARRFADRLVQAMREQPPGAPFNYRLRLGLTRAPAVEPMDERDLSAHVYRLRLGGKASMDDLVAKVCELHETPLPREGLLWQLTVIDGLADGRIALYGKVHHGIIDGKTFVKVLGEWLSSDPAQLKPRAMRQGLERQSRARAALVRGEAGGGGAAPALPHLGVPQVLTGAVPSKRTHAFITLPLDTVKALGRASGATVDDILLTLPDIALDRYLTDRPRRARKPMIVDMPVALSGAPGGNQIAVLQLALGSPGMAPAKRLQAIRGESERLKSHVRPDTRRRRHGVAASTANPEADPITHRSL